MPGQCFSKPSLSNAKRSGSLDGVSSSLRTWQCAIDAPASKAACVLATCSATVIGTAGLLALVGTEPVMATQRIQGFVMVLAFQSRLRRSFVPRVTGRKTRFRYRPASECQSDRRSFHRGAPVAPEGYRAGGPVRSGP